MLSNVQLWQKGGAREGLCYVGLGLGLGAVLAAGESSKDSSQPIASASDRWVLPERPFRTQIAAYSAAHHPPAYGLPLHPQQKAWWLTDIATSVRLTNPTCIE